MAIGKTTTNTSLVFTILFSWPPVFFSSHLVKSWAMTQKSMLKRSAAVVRGHSRASPLQKNSPRRRAALSVSTTIPNWMSLQKNVNDTFTAAMWRLENTQLTSTSFGLPPPPAPLPLQTRGTSSWLKFGAAVIVPVIARRIIDMFHEMLVSPCCVLGLFMSGKVDIPPRVQFFKTID